MFSSQAARAKHVTDGRTWSSSTPSLKAAKAARLVPRAAVAATEAVTALPRDVEAMAQQAAEAVKRSVLRRDTVSTW